MGLITRRLLAQKLGFGILIGLGGCVGSITESNGKNLTINFKGDKNEGEKRSIVVLVSEVQSGKDIITSKTEKRLNLHSGTGVYFEKYELEPPEMVNSTIYIQRSGTYELSVWVEGRGSITTKIQISDYGHLSKHHKIIITSDGINSQTI